jgi:hypothetical protein
MDPWLAIVFACVGAVCSLVGLGVTVAVIVFQSGKVRQSLTGVVERQKELSKEIKSAFTLAQSTQKTVAVLGERLGSVKEDVAEIKESLRVLMDDRMKGTNERLPRP